MSEERLIRQCAPTLAGIKTGSLFPCPYETREELMADVRAFNRRFAARGLCLLPLRLENGHALLYLYRPAELRRDLQNGAALWAPRGEEFPSESPSASRSAGPKTLAAKVEPWGPPRLFAIRAVSQRSQPMPYIMICLFSAKTALLICMIKSEKFKQNVQISLGKLEVLPQVVYNKS